MALTVGQIGAGRVAAAHMAAFVRHPQVREAHFADPDPLARERLTAQFGIIKHACENYHDLLADERIDVVDICTPNHLHATQAIEAMQAGKHVIVEAPPALTADECDAMMRVSRETGRRLFCVLSRRRLPANVRAEAILAEGAIGRPFLATVTILTDDLERMSDPEDWAGDWERAGGGAMLGAGYHAVYTLQRFFGLPHAVTATARRLAAEVATKADDTAVMTLEMPDGMLCNVLMTCAASGDRASEERRIHGTQGSLLIRDDPEDELPLVVFHGADFFPVRVHNPPRVQNYAIRETVRHFLDCIVEGTDSDITLDQARAALATVTAAYQSDREGRHIQL